MQSRLDGTMLKVGVSPQKIMGVLGRLALVREITRVLQTYNANGCNEARKLT